MKNKNFLFLILIVLLALALRLFAMLGQGSFWFDEIFTVHFAKYNLGEMFAYIINDHNPPLHFIFIHYWIKLVGTGEFLVRISSLILGLANILLIYVIGKKIFSKKVGLLSSFFSSISLFHIYYSTEARMYGLLLFFSLLSIYFFWNVLTNYKRKYFVLYLIFTALALFTHLTGLFILIIQNIFIVYLYLKKEQLLSIPKWVIGQISIFFIFLIWFVPMAFLKFSSSADLIQGWYFSQNVEHFFLENINNFFVFGKYQEFISLILQMIIWVLLILSFLSVRREDKEYKFKFNFSNPIVYLLIWLFVPLVIGFIFNINVTKYYIIASPALFILMSKGISNLRLEKKYFIILLIILFLLVFPLTPQRVKGQWPDIVNYIESEADERTKVITNPFTLALPVKYYSSSQYILEGFYPLSDEDDWQMRIIKKNWYPVISKENAEKLQYSTYNFDRILLLTFYIDEFNKDDFVKQWFLKNNWKIVEEKEFYADIGIVKFERVK